MQNKETNNTEKKLQDFVKSNDVNGLNQIVSELLNDTSLGFLFLQCRDKDFRTLMHLACAHGHENILNRLLELDGSSLFSHDNAEKTPLDLALENKRPNIIRRLLNLGAGICADINGEFPQNFNTDNLILIDVTLNGKKLTRGPGFEKAITTVEELKNALENSIHLELDTFAKNCSDLTKVYQYDNQKTTLLAEIGHVINEKLQEQKSSLNPI